MISVYKKSFGAAFIALAILTGCGNNMLEFSADKNSDAATKEAAQILIDRGDYDAAIALLDSQCPNFTCASDDDAQQLAAAYMGAAGLDMLDLLKNADSSSGSGSDFTAISKLLPEVTAENFKSMDSAITLLSNIGNKTDDQLLQLSVAQLTAAEMAIGLAGGEGYDSDGVPNSCGGDCSAADTSTLLATNITTADGTSITAGAYATAAINDSVTNVNNITVLSDSDIADQTNGLAADMQGSTDSTCDSGGGTPTGDVDETDLGNYLQSCI